MRIDLKRPIEHDGKTVPALTIREATLGDLIAMEEVKGGELAKFSAFLARLTGEPEGVIRKLSATDLQTIQGKAGHLLGNEEGVGGG